MIAHKYGNMVALLAVGLTCLACDSTPTAPGSTVPSDTTPICVGSLCNRSVLDRLGLDIFYQKYLDADGIPIVSSGRVPDRALEAARDIVNGMLEARSDVRDSMQNRGARVGIMARTEVTTDIPEHAFLANDPNTDWNRRARGLGGTLNIPITTGAEENVLCLPEDVYRGENILVHEFAHGMHLIGIDLVDPTFSSRLRDQYTAAMRDGLWADTYAATNTLEYWAEGVQSWFDVDQEPQPGIHNDINTRAELVVYDPGLAELIEEFFPERGWRPSCPTMVAHSQP